MSVRVCVKCVKQERERERVKQNQFDFVDKVCYSPFIIDTKKLDQQNRVNFIAKEIKENLRSLKIVLILFSK